jgi:hypothetical protein
VDPAERSLTARTAVAGCDSAVLTGVAGRADNVWATGFGITTEFQIVPCFVRWNGKAWSHVPAPSTIRGGCNVIAATADQAC